MATKQSKMQVGHFQSSQPDMIPRCLTIHDFAANISRRLVDLSPNAIGTMATVYPEDHSMAGKQSTLAKSMSLQLIRPGF